MQTNLCPGSPLRKRCDQIEGLRHLTGLCSRVARRGTPIQQLELANKCHTISSMVSAIKPHLAAAVIEIPAVRMTGTARTAFDSIEVLVAAASIAI